MQLGESGSCLKGFGRLRGRRLIVATTVAFMVVANSTGAVGELTGEQVTVATVPDSARDHWVWVNDMVFAGVADGKAFLFDGDSGKMLGLLNTGYLFGLLTLPSHGKEIYAVETYFSRGTRGKRSDFLTVYDPKTLSPKEEISIPPKKASGIPMASYYGISDDDRFAYIYNFTPAQSVTVVDVEKRRVADEIETPGCALVYPSGDRRFEMLCANGGIMTVDLTRKGKLDHKSRKERFFDPADPITEKGVRWKDTWVFVSFDGIVHSVDVSSKSPLFGPKWSMFTDAERTEGWKIGGVQHLAVHEKSGTLYSLVHVGEKDSHKDGGVDVWVYDLETRKRVRKISLANFTTSIQVTQDDAPLLFGAMIVSSTLDVYDARKGQHLRAIEEAGSNPTFLQVH